MSFWVQAEEIWVAVQKRAGSKLFSFLVDGGSVALTRRLWKTSRVLSSAISHPRVKVGPDPPSPSFL